MNSFFESLLDNEKVTDITIEAALLVINKLGSKLDQETSSKKNEQKKKEEVDLQKQMFD